MFKDFKEFVMRGNVLDLAIGIIIGAAFGTIVNSLVKDIIMPPVGLALGNLDFSNMFWVLKEGSTAAPPYYTIADAQAAGAVTLNYGVFINTIISFIIIAFAIFLIVRVFNKARKTMEAKKEAAAPAPPATKECPFCSTTIPVKANRCPNCTSELKAA
jgi:large conductance mechanosensitive channel